MGVRGLLRETEAWQEGTWEGARDPACMGATLASWHRWRAPELSVNARVGGRVLGFGDRPGAPEAPGWDPGCLEPQVEQAIEGQPWTSGLSQGWGDLVVPCVCFMSTVSPAGAWLPACLSAWTAPCVWNRGCDLRGRSSRGACPPPPPAFGGSVWGDADPGECSPRRVCEPGARRRPGSQGLSGVARLRSRG